MQAMNHEKQTICPRCGEPFGGPEALHECGVYSVTTLFSGVEPRIFELYLRFEELARTEAVEVTARRTGVEFAAAGGVFAFVEPNYDHLLVNLCFEAVDRHPRFTAIEHTGPGAWMHTLRIEHERGLDDALEGWLERARG